MVRVAQNPKPYFTVSSEPPNQEGQVPVFISPRNRVAQLYPRALGSLYVVFYDSQGYSGGIVTFIIPGGTGSYIYIYIAFRNRMVLSKVKSMSNSKVKVTLRLTASESVCPGA
jgi:hypothetical protein